MTSKSTVDNRSDLSQGRALQNDASDKILLWSIVTPRSIHKDWKAVNLGKGIHIDAVKVVHAIEGAGGSGSPVVWYVGFREKICDVRGRVDHRGSDDADKVRNVCAPNLCTRDDRVSIISLGKTTYLKMIVNSIFSPTRETSLETCAMTARDGEIRMNLREEIITHIGLQEGFMDLSLIDGFAGFGVQCSNIILR